MLLLSLLVGILAVLLVSCIHVVIVITCRHFGKFMLTSWNVVGDVMVNCAFVCPIIAKIRGNYNNKQNCKENYNT